MQDKEKGVRTMKKELMTNAWEIAKEAAKKFGGKAIEYIAGAMKMAWAAIKIVTLVLPNSKQLKLKCVNLVNGQWLKC